MPDNQQDSNKPKEERKFNQEQYDMLKRCSEKGDMSEWNQWRKNNLGEKVILSEVDLSGTDLSGANLSKADLSEADLSRTYLFGANLFGANLSRAYLSEANLSETKLIRADLSGANLSRVNLSKAKLSGTYLSKAKLIRANLSEANLSGTELCKADLSEANLSKAKLSGADLFGANLSRAYLSEANLSEANLSGASFYCANLSEANLSEANLFEAYLLVADLSRATLSGADLSRATLSGADLSRADLFNANFSEANLSDSNLSGADLSDSNLSNADLSEANLCYCQLVRTDLTNAILRKVTLYGTARDDWKIEGVKCDYVYWDSDKNRRSPKDRDFKPGEFEKLYKALPTIEIFFENGMNPIDPVIMNSAVSTIRQRKPDYDLKIDSINNRGLTPSIKLTVQKEEQKEEALSKVKDEFQITRSKLEGQIESLQKVIKIMIDKPSTINNYLVHDVENVAIAGSTINKTIQYIQNITELQKIIATESEDSKTFAKTAKDKAMDVLGGAAEDIAKGLVKEAARKIIEVGKDLGPVILKTAAYAFFKSLIP